jgi:ATP-binding cassette subfamily B protein
MKWRNENASDEEIRKALDIAQASEFVFQKPKQLDEPVLQEGKNLSGGQRQRLTIARALIGSPEILILDDSASALDLATDAKLRKAIAEQTSGMTVLIVSQRISSIRNADKIIVLDDGKVAGIGSHRQLYKDCDVYREICLSQLSEKEVEELGRE